MATVAEQNVNQDSAKQPDPDKQHESFASASNEELSAVLQQTLKEKFGYDEFLPGQCEAMQH